MIRLYFNLLLFYEVIGIVFLTIVLGAFFLAMVENKFNDWKRQRKNRKK